MTVAKKPTPVLEICVDSVESAVAAEAGGAQRIELCSALAEGGLTPSLGLIRAVRRRVALPVHVLIRPRPGDFVYTADELQVTRDDIEIAGEAGAEGVVLGLLTEEAEVDVEATRRLVQHARPMRVTFHRALDTVRDLERGLTDILQTGADRILSSGGARTALEGQETLARLVHLAGDRIAVMVGGSVRPENAVALARATGATDFHAALRHSLPPSSTRPREGVMLGDPLLDQQARTVVRVEDVRSLRSALELACDVGAALRS